jgi:hypothetical protein
MMANNYVGLVDVYCMTSDRYFSKSIEHFLLIYVGTFLIYISNLYVFENIVEIYATLVLKVFSKKI